MVQLLWRMILVGWFLFVSCGDAFGNLVNIDNTQLNLNLSRQLLILEDKNASLDLAAAQMAMADGEFKTTGSDHLQLGYSDSTYWLYLRLKINLVQNNEQVQVGRFYLNVDYPLLDTVTLHYIRGSDIRDADTSDGGHSTWIAGDSLPFSQRHFSLNGFVFPLDLNSGEQADIYIRIQSSSSLHFPIKLQSEQTFVDERFGIDMLDGAYVGIAVGLGIYNLFLWVGIRSRVYGLYVLMVFSMLLFNASITGLTFRLWPESLYFQQICVYTFSFLAGVFLILFGMEYLNTRVSLPVFHRFFQGLLGVGGVAFIVMFFVSIPVAAKLTAVITMVSAVALIVAAIVRLMQGYRPAIYYCLGQGALLVGVLFTALSAQKIIPAYHLAPIVMKWSSALELILFSIGLAYLVNNERRLREQAQQESALAQQELLDSQIKLNRDLDELVTQRTRELEQANQLLREMNTHDELTGLRNRRYLNQVLAKEYARAFRDKKPISLLMMDIDHFKQLNDSYGHQFGDCCLVEASKLLQGGIRRPPDVAARYGGEEFVILLPNTDLQGALVVAEKLRLAIDRLEVVHGGQSVNLTASVGVACEVPTQRDGYEALLSNADRYLYQAKSNGRNRVESAFVSPSLRA